MNSTYRVRRSSRKSMGIYITPKGEVEVRCPYQATQEQITQLVEDHKDWIETHLAKLQAQPQLPPFTDQEIDEMANEALTRIPPRVAHFAKLLGVTYGRITIRNQRSRWGSCSSRGNLNFNCLLMLVPAEVMDYVVVHELCHRKHMNHSQQFWAEVEKLIPDYKAHRQWLKEQGTPLIGRLDG